MINSAPKNPFGPKGLRNGTSKKQNNFFLPSAIKNNDLSIVYSSCDTEAQASLSTSTSPLAALGSAERNLRMTALGKTK